ncbi:MAG: hypothetical protein LUC33_04055 [Prevotellaceae bacterium]|nr:hypothetical protein [Prevotellaceae bacterium]
MKKLMTIAAAALLLAGCSHAAKETETEKGPRCLVLYYSQTGTTETVAQTIADLIGEEAVSFDVKEPYNGTFEETIARCQDEMADDIVPTLKSLPVNIEDYDVIFLGYPIWFGTYARPVAALLQEVDFEGKTIVPFCTFGSGGLEASVADLRAACPEAIVTDGFGIRAARIDKVGAEVKQFLINGGYVEGEKEEHVEYGEENPLGDKEKTIYEQATGDYPMPLGTPTGFRVKETAEGTKYVFIVSTTNRDGEPAEGYVLVTCAEGEQPEFTKVVR